jgi:hypothetical protein
MDEIREFAELASPTGVLGTALYVAWRLQVRYLPNWRERIEMRQKANDVMRELGLTIAEFRQHRGFDSAPKQLAPR